VLEIRLPEFVLRLNVLFKKKGIIFEKNKMSNQKDIKLLTVKKGNPDLYEKVLNGEMSIQDAYNETKRIQLGLTEFRGKSTKKKEFATDFKRIIQLHNPSSAELIEEIKRAFPLTWKEFLK
jgi:hypothetical protein